MFEKCRQIMRIPSSDVRHVTAVHTGRAAQPHTPKGPSWPEYAANACHGFHAARTGGLIGKWPRPVVLYTFPSGLVHPPRSHTFFNFALSSNFFLLHTHLRCYHCIVLRASHPVRPFRLSSNCPEFGQDAFGTASRRRRGGSYEHLE